MLYIPKSFVYSRYFQEMYSAFSPELLVSAGIQVICYRGQFYINIYYITGCMF